MATKRGVRGGIERRLKRGAVGKIIVGSLGNILFFIKRKSVLRVTKSDVVV